MAWRPLGPSVSRTHRGNSMNLSPRRTTILVGAVHPVSFARIRSPVILLTFNVWLHTQGMRNLLASLYDCLRAALKARRDLGFENLALGQQLAVLKRSQTRLKIKQSDRLFWIWLSRTWSGWRPAPIIVKPATVVGWHRRGFKFCWTNPITVMNCEQHDEI
jgi:hypothetical protein